MSATIEMEDVELMRLAASSDSEAIGELYDRHSGLMNSVLMQTLADPHDAEDILHDVFSKFPAKASSYRSNLGQPVAWLLTVARNAARDRLRRRETHRRYLAKVELENSGSSPAFSGPYFDEVQLITNALQALPEAQSEPLTLAYFGGFTMPEIALKLKAPLGTVKARMRRGLMELRHQVGNKVRAWECATNGMI